LYFELSERALELIINNKKRMGIISIFGERTFGEAPVEVVCKG
jgi:hypothetical protein